MKRLPDAREPRRPWLLFAPSSLVPLLFFAGFLGAAPAIRALVSGGLAVRTTFGVEHAHIAAMTISAGVGLLMTMLVMLAFGVWKRRLPVESRAGER